MAQNPLPPPPPSGSVLDGWLYLLWRRLTQSGQILWESITPGTSADVAAVVTDETGSPGSLVFSANPTLAGCNVATGYMLVGYGTAQATGSFTASAQVNAAGAAASFAVIRNTTPGAGGGLFAGAASRGAAGTFTALQANDGIMTFTACGADGTSFVNACGQIIFAVDGAFSTGIVPTRIVFLTMDAAGVRTEAFRIDSTQRFVAAKTIATGGYTVATLPAGTVGDRAYVTAALAPAYGVAVAGAGAVTIPVFYNGAAWICA